MPVRVGSSEGLGVAALARTATRREAPPDNEHQHCEDRVGHCEHPEGSIVVDEPLKPVLDEALLVRSGTCLNAEPGFQCCERTELPQPGLKDDNGNGRQMRQPKPQPVDPAPVQPVSCQNHDKAAHNEEHDSEVEDEHCIS